MIRKIVFLVVLLVGLLPTTHAQRGLEEVVYLKNGSVIRGVIVEQIPGKTLKIETKDGSSFIYRMQEIEKITKEPGRGRRFGSNMSQNIFEPAPTRRSGKTALIQLSGIGYLENSSYQDALFFEVNFVYGYRFNPYWFVGGGIGMEHSIGNYYDSQFYWSESSYYPHENNDTYYNLGIPLFASVKTNLTATRVSPFFQVDLGYKVNTNSEMLDGFFVLPKIGLDFNMGASRRTALFASLSITELGRVNNRNYNRINNPYYDQYTELYYENDNFYEFLPKIGLNIGLRF